MAQSGSRPATVKDKLTGKTGTGKVATVAGSSHSGKLPPPAGTTGKPSTTATVSGQKPPPTSKSHAKSRSGHSHSHSDSARTTGKLKPETDVQRVKGQHRGQIRGKGSPVESPWASPRCPAHSQRPQQHQEQHRHETHAGHQHRHHGPRGNSCGFEMGIKNMEQVDEDTMIQTVEILKRPGQSLGFYIREGNGLDRSDGVFISRIASGSVVENNGLMRVGDEIVTVNSVDVSKMGLDDVVILMSIPKRLVLTIRTRKACCKNASCPSLSTLEQEEEPPPVVVVKKGRSSSATAVEMTEKCPDEFILSSADARAYYAKYGTLPIYPQQHHQHPSGVRMNVRGYSSDVEESPYARISDLQYYLPQYPGARDHHPINPSQDSKDHGRERRSPKMGLKEAPMGVTFRSPHAGRRHISPYHLDYSSDTDTRYLHERGLTEGHYSVPRVPPKSYDPQAVKAFQEEIERSHHKYEQMASAKGRFVKTQRSLSPERYNSDSEIQTVYRGRERDHIDRIPGRDPYLSQLMDSDDRCNSLPQMEPGESSEELKHWLKKFDNLSFELQGQPTSEPSKTSAVTSSTDSPTYTPRPGLAMASGSGVVPMPIMGDKDSYTSEEYWSWAQHHTSPPSTMQRTETTFPRTTRTTPRPRVTRKLSADSLMDYRTYQMEDTQEQSPDHRAPVQRSSRTMQPHGSPHPLVKTRQASMDIESRIPHSPSSRLRDLQLGRKPIQIRTDDFRLFQPEMEERKPKIDQTIEGMLRVHIYCGHGLKSSRTMLRDLYTVIEVDSLNKARTMIRTGAINFDWDEAFDVELETAQEMSFLVYSWDPNTRHRLCFSGTVALPNLLQYGVYQKIALKLEPKGILYLELEYQEPALSLQRMPSIRKNALFGVDLETVIRREKSTVNVPVLVRKCIEEVERRGLDHVGIYRLCGSARRKAQLKEEFEKNAKMVDLSADAVSDINVITGVLKDFLRELPEPLFTNALYQMLLDALSVRLPSDPDGSAKLMLSILECLPKANQETMAYVLDHLKHVAIKQDANKMTTQNLAVCFGPVLLCPSPQSAVDVQQALDFKRHIEVLRYLLDIWPENRDSSQPLSIEQLDIKPDALIPHHLLRPSGGQPEKQQDEHRDDNEEQDHTPAPDDGTHWQQDHISPC